MYSAASAKWFELASGLRGVPYLAGATAATKYELAPSLEAVIACVGALLGEPTVRTPAALEALWARVQPERAVRLDANVYGDRLALSERDETAGGEARCTLELVMKAGLNHAFAIHHWRPPVWQRPIAELAATHWPPPATPSNGWTSAGMSATTGSVLAVLSLIHI